MEHQERAMRYAQGISRMIQVDTVRRPGQDAENFHQLHVVMEELFPHVFSHCRKWEFESSLLFCWQGKSHEKPLLLMSHQDVVEAPGPWKYPPFSGTIAEGKLWGRGTLDVKGNLFSILQAVEELIREGVVPSHDVYIASSHEEETGGNTYIVDFLKENGIVPDLLVDEGSSLQPCPVPGFQDQVGLVAVAEKGYIDIRCVAKGPGGHASEPGKNTPLPRLGAFMCDVEQGDLFPVHLSSASREMYRRMIDVVDDAKLQEDLRAVVAEEPGWQERLDAKQRERLATTVAFTMAAGSAAANVIPQEAYVVCNVRIAPGESVESTLETLRKVAEPHQVELEVMRSNEPSPITDPGSDSFSRVEKAIQSAWPGTLVLPYVLTGGTDTKHFVQLCPNCLRFTAYKVSALQQSRCHAIDENIDLDTIPNGVDFFKALIQEM